MSLKKLLKSAKDLSSKLDTGKEFLTRNVYVEMEKVASENSNDVMINMMKDYVLKRASSSDFISQKDIGEAYDSLINYAGGERSTQFRVKLAKYLPVGHGHIEEVVREDYSHMRGGEQKVKTLQEYGTGLDKLASELSGVFSLSGKTTALSAHSNDTNARVIKVASAQMKSFGCEPKSVIITAQNEHFALCKAAFNTASKREVSIDFPVQISSGSPRFPTQFLDNGKLVEMNKLTVLSYLKEKEDMKKFDARQKFASERETSSVAIENINTPKELSYLTDIEDKIATAASKFDSQQVNLARNTLATELKSAGFNSQIKLAGFGERHIEFSANLGREEITFPVEISGGRPLMPSSFISDNKKFAFTSANLMKVAKSSIKTASSFSYHKDNYSNMSYHQLMSEMIRGVSDKDYAVSEDALKEIQARYDDTMSAHAVKKYASLLKTAGMNSEREDLIKQALHRGDLIRVPTSVDLYSPKLGLPLSKLSFDSKGDLIPLSRVLQRENQGESEIFGISSHQIKIN